MDSTIHIGCQLSEQTLSPIDGKTRTGRHRAVVRAAND